MNSKWQYAYLIKYLAFDENLLHFIGWVPEQRHEMSKKKNKVIAIGSGNNVAKPKNLFSST